MNYEQEEDEGDHQMMCFTQQEPELTQPSATAKPIESRNFDKLEAHLQESLVTDLSRLLLFKGLSGEPIDRSKLAKEAWGDKYKTDRILGAALDKAKQRLYDVWGFEVRGVPQFMCDLKSFPSKYKDRLYITNKVHDDETGRHSKAIHRVHTHSAVEKGLLMLILAFIRCRGEVSEGMRWLNDAILYRLLHTVDENIPGEPPSTTSKQKRSSENSAVHELDEEGTTPNVDAALEKFVHMDYLIKKKQERAAGATQSDQTHFLYAMGPRAGAEIGRKQVIFFCAELLGEQPDPTMLAEIKDDPDDEAMNMDEEED